jgi:hypothetical protein
MAIVRFGWLPDVHGSQCGGHCQIYAADIVGLLDLSGSYRDDSFFFLKYYRDDCY